MLLTPTPCRRGDTLDQFAGHMVGGIGAFSHACVDGHTLQQPLEVLLVQGNHDAGFIARVADADHRLYHGPLDAAEVSFTLEAFQMTKDGEPLTQLRRDSAAHQCAVRGELRACILETIEREKIRGALLYFKGIATDLQTYGHIDPIRLDDTTKTFDHVAERVELEGWGNLSCIDGVTPFVHMHGTYSSRGTNKGGHFIMDDTTPLMVDTGDVLVYPVPSLTRTQQGEPFPTWDT
jgi:predicted DNA-binding protein with PD1-like motif